MCLLQKAEIRNGKSVKRAVKLAWESVADPPILKFFNWEGRLRRDRPVEKSGVRKLLITTAILGNESLYLHLENQHNYDCFVNRWLTTCIPRSYH